MKKLEKVISTTLGRFKNKNMNLLSESAREALVSAIAEDIRNEIRKERDTKKCN